jgi:hypothetical protein
LSYLKRGISRSDKEGQEKGACPLFHFKEWTNVLVWNDTKKMVEEAFKILGGRGKKAKIPEYWDGKTAERIIKNPARETC